ncbi:MAG: DegT/DnrJ/EryC1/StrS family aminotransferase [Candidatus Eisenbacteria bacterium]
MTVLAHRHATPPTRLRYQRPQLPSLAEVAPYYAKSEAAHWYSNGGPCHELLVQRLESRMGNGALALPVGNATLGLMVALAAVTQDQPARCDLVITPSYTFAAAVSSILWTGRQPLLVDVHPRHWQLDEHALAQALERYDGRVAAVLGTSTFGCPPPAATRARWQALCDEAGVPLVMDSAAAFGAELENGGWLGTQGAVEVFSFHATKPFAIGEGGLVTTRSPELRERMARLVNFGFDAQRMVQEPLGMNAKLSELQSAVSLAVLDRFDAVLAARRALAAAITAALEPEGYRFQSGAPRSTWQSVPVLAPDAATREAVRARAAEHDVEVRAYFETPLHAHPPFAGFPRADALAVTEDLAARCLSLPMANDLRQHDVERIIAVVRSEAFRAAA